MSLGGYDALILASKVGIAATERPGREATVIAWLKNRGRSGPAREAQRDRGAHRFLRFQREEPSMRANGSGDSGKSQAPSRSLGREIRVD